MEKPKIKQVHLVAEMENGDIKQCGLTVKQRITLNEFKRQMFYTLADYRDICTGDEKVIEVLKASGDENIKDISDKTPYVNMYRDDLSKSNYTLAVTI